MNFEVVAFLLENKKYSKIRRNLMKTLRYLFVYLLVVGLAGCQPDSVEAPETYLNADLLVEADWLADNLGSENLVVVDMREEREGEFIPGAIDVGGVPALIDPNHEVEHFLIGPDQFAELMSNHGIGNDSNIIIYDDIGNLRSARLFHALEYYGHQNVQILNGGVPAWKAGGHPLAEAPAEPLPESFVVQLNEGVVCDIQEILAAIDDEDTIILDARPSDQYLGETVWAERGGHIPGAVNIHWETMITDGDIPYFKSAEEIAQIYADHEITPDKRVITHCHSNMQASNAYFVLRLMGYQNITSYEGSWSEYGNTEGVPVEI